MSLLNKSKQIIFQKFLKKIYWGDAGFSDQPQVSEEVFSSDFFLILCDENGMVSLLKEIASLEREDEPKRHEIFNRIIRLFDISMLGHYRRKGNQMVLQWSYKRIPSTIPMSNKDSGASVRFEDVISPVEREVLFGKKESFFYNVNGEDFFLGCYRKGISTFPIKADYLGALFRLIFR